MATNTTKQTSAGATDITEDHPERTRRAPAVVGPPLGEGQEPVTVTLSHHLRIGAADFTPGAEITVSPDYARRLHGQGFTART
ncbi:hypothetical protein [Streptomyces sp. NPDC059850]|uniref:hypothetical protein n=1 Tax=Streptomyces sp. NPDC059850 TaxID=3346970 RepID=UPI0036670336